MLQQDIDFFKGNDRLFLFFMNLTFPVAPAELVMEELPFLSLTTFQISSQPLLETSPLFHCGHISYFCFSVASSLSVHGRPMLMCSVSVPFLPFFRPLRIILAEDFYKKLKA